MNDEMMELYQSLILDHNKNPRNFRKIDDATYVQEGFNPLCGDHLHLYIKLDPEKKIIVDIAFEGQGCAISKASTSMMTQTLKGKSLEEAQKMFAEFHDLLIRKLDPSKEVHHLGKLEVFSGIWKYPARVKCAGPAWHTLKAALDEKKEIVKTE
jgi:nitrogen fixation NifU-like protein